MKYRLGMCWLVMVALLLPTKVFAEDIDLFVGRSTTDEDIPNVLIILDNTANWGPEVRWLEQKAALNEAFEVIEEEYLGRIKLGLMLYTESGSTGDDSGNSNDFDNGAGAYVRSAVRLMDQAGIDALRRLIAGDDPSDVTQGLNEGDDKGSGARVGLAMAEAYLYFLGGGEPWEKAWAGSEKVKACFTGNVSSSSPWSQEAWALGTRPLDTNALDSFSDDIYNSPVVPGSCGGNYIIYIGNGPGSDNNSDKESTREILKNMEGVSDIWMEENEIQLTRPNGRDIQNAMYSILGDEWAYFMLKDSPLAIQTYVIDVNIVQREGQCEGNAAESWSAVAESMATEIPQKETYFRQCGLALEPGKFKEDFLSAIGGILSRNSVFASVALPAAANEQSTFLNNVYVGQFRPDPNASPRWFGNLKQYKIGIVVDPDNEAEVLQVVDADGLALIETVEEADNAGFVKGCARSFWTPEAETQFTGPTGDPEYYWDYLARVDTDETNNAVQNCLKDEDGFADAAGSNTADGQIVEKGGQAYTLRKITPDSRNVWTWDCSSEPDDLDTVTCKNASLMALDPNDAYSASLEAALDPNDSTDRDELIKWAIGYDVDDEDQDGVTDEMRPTVHGDIVHSQPVAKDFAGDPNNPEVVVFYGGNDGMLRAINGNQTTAHASVTTVAAGYEYWAFMPSEFYGEIKRLRVNEDAIKFPASGPTAGQGVSGSEPKGYGMDGPLSIYEFDRGEDADGDVELNLFAGMRRAGRTIYSFDVSDRTTPKLNWKIGCPSLDPNDPVGCTDGMEDIGQTWSRVGVTYAAGYLDGDDELAPLILVGGGYDVCEDYDGGLTDKENNSCSSTKGNVIYLLDAVTGEIVMTFPTDRSVPGNITVVPVEDGDPRIMFAYAVDMGGNVYRISGARDEGGNTVPAIIGDIDPSEVSTPWIITKIASLGCNGAAADVANCTGGGSPSNRKFLFAPDVIRLAGDMFGVFVGTGDREKPMLDYAATTGVTNYFYGLFDAPLIPDWLDGECTDGDGNDTICQSSLATLDPNDIANGVEPTEKGWRLELRDGEQVVTGAITADNDVYFSTHIPTQPEACDADYGTATAYSLNYNNASGTDTEFLGGGLVPTPVAGKVIIDGVPVPFCIGCGAEGSPIGVGKVGGGITWTQPRSRVYWNIDRVE